MRATKKTAPQDIFNSIAELAGFLKDDPGSLDQELNDLGKKYLTDFKDRAFKSSFPGLTDLKIATIGKASRDIAEGLTVLRTSSIGIYFKDKRMFPFVVPYTETPPGHIVFNIGWINPQALSADLDIPQDILNACIYRLAVVLSEIIRKER
jgi:hypothetical protein